MAIYERYGDAPSKRFNGPDVTGIDGKNFPLGGGRTIFSAEPWIPRKQYYINSLVTYNGKTYRGKLKHNNRTTKPNQDLSYWVEYTNTYEKLTEVKYRNHTYWPSQRSFTFETLRTTGELFFKIATSTGYAAVIVDGSYMVLCGPGEPFNELNPVKYSSFEDQTPEFIGTDQARQLVGLDNNIGTIGTTKQAYVTDCIVPLHPINTYTIEARGSTFDTYNGDLESGFIAVKVQLKEMIGSDPTKFDSITVTVKDNFPLYDKETAKYHSFSGELSSITHSKTKPSVQPGEETIFEFHGLRSSFTFGNTENPIQAKEVSLEVRYTDENGNAQVKNKDDFYVGNLLSFNVELGAAGEEIPPITKNLTLTKQSTYFLNQTNISVDSIENPEENGHFEIPTEEKLENTLIALREKAGFDRDSSERLETALIDIEEGFSPTRTKLEIIPLTKTQLIQAANLTQTDISIQVERVGATNESRDSFGKLIPSTAIYRLELINGGSDMTPLCALPLDIGPSNHARVNSNISNVGLQSVYHIYPYSSTPKRNYGNIRILTDNLGRGAGFREFPIEEEEIFNKPDRWNNTDWELFKVLNTASAWVQDGTPGIPRFKYSVGDHVAYNNKTYQCIKEHYNRETTPDEDTQYWTDVQDLGLEEGPYGMVPFTEISKNNESLSQYIGNLNYAEDKVGKRERVQQIAIEDQFNANVIYLSGGYADFVYRDNFTEQQLRNPSLDLTPRFSISSMSMTPGIPGTPIPGVSNKNIRVFDVTPSVDEERRTYDVDNYKSGDAKYRYPIWEGYGANREGTALDRFRDPEGGFFGTTNARLFSPTREADLYAVEFGAYNRQDIFNIKAVGEPELRYVQCRHTEMSDNMTLNKEVEVGRNWYLDLEKVKGNVALKIENCPKFVQPLGKDWQFEYDFTIANAPKISVADSAQWVTAGGVRNDSEFKTLPYKTRRFLIQQSARNVMRVMLDLFHIDFLLEAQAKNVDIITFNRVNVGYTGYVFRDSGLDYIDLLNTRYENLTGNTSPAYNPFSSYKYSITDPQKSLPTTTEQMAAKFAEFSNLASARVPIKGVEVMYWSRSSAAFGSNAAKVNVIAKFAPVRMYTDNATFDDNLGSIDGRNNKGFDEDDFVGFGFGNFNGNDHSRSKDLATNQWIHYTEDYDTATSFKHPLTISSFGGPGVARDIGSELILCSYISTGMQQKQRTQTINSIKNDRTIDNALIGTNAVGAETFSGGRMNLPSYAGFNFGADEGQPALKVSRRFAYISGVPFIEYLEIGGKYEQKTGTWSWASTKDEFIWVDIDPDTDYENTDSDTDNMPTEDETKDPNEGKMLIPNPALNAPPGIPGTPTPSGKQKGGGAMGNTVRWGTYTYETVNYGAKIGNVKFIFADD